MKHHWKPTAIQGADGNEIAPKVEGEVIVDLPKYVQRLRYLKEAKFKINSDGSVGQDVDNLEMSIKAVELAEKHIESVNLKVIESGEELTTVDDLQYSPYGADVLTEIGFLVLNGPSVGNA